MKKSQFPYEKLSRTRIKYLLSKYLDMHLYSLKDLDNDKEDYEEMWVNVYRFLRSEISVQQLCYEVHMEDYDDQDPKLQDYLKFNSELEKTIKTYSKA